MHVDSIKPLLADLGAADFNDFTAVDSAVGQVEAALLFDPALHSVNLHEHLETDIVANLQGLYESWETNL